MSIMANQYKEELLYEIEGLSGEKLKQIIEPTHKRKIHYNIKYVPPIRIILFCKFINQI
ncbi:Uncharacterized protein dnl_14700 [Desulfonema limicola]|uniref:Uncharacterized protein n=1 Tax=Desulfonema limicola TaxID=45656 RepID=A0A975GFI3_9BACT|nr:Uncharacterized protein dnl_14700 [Desulfonema limicola]